jgi:D-arabinose 1-dehydrogenase-like Zn-dependent alcohol dehydrogenase
MKAFIVDRYKSKDGLRFGDMPDPELRDEDVMVQVHAASLNPLDPKIRDGEFKFILPYRLPLVLGNDLAGVVVRVGPKVRGFEPGDKVYARPNQDRIGTFAEFISMNEADVALKPKNLTMEEAASIPLVGLTAWQVLVERANLKKGQKVLIHAGSGGVGTFAIQLAKHLGATVATTTGTANVDLVKSLGADIVIDYKEDDFEKVLNGYDVVLNSLAKDTLEKISPSAEARWKAHLNLRSARYRFCQGQRIELVLATGHATFELWNSPEGQAPSRKLFVSFRESERRAVALDHVAHRSGRHPPGPGSGFLIRSHQGGLGVHRNGTFKREGRRQG